jgi:hypothetical protein
MAMAFWVQIVRALEGDISLEDLNDNEGVRPGQSMAFVHVLLSRFYCFLQ